MFGIVMGFLLSLFSLFFSGIFVVLREQGHPDVGAYKGAGSSLRLRCSIWTSTSTRSESSFGSILLLFSVFIQRLVSSVRQRRVVCVEQAAFFLWERLRDSALRAKMVSSVVSASGDTLFPWTNFADCCGAFMPSSLRMCFCLDSSMVHVPAAILL